MRIIARIAVDMEHASLGVGPVTDAQFAKGGGGGVLFFSVCQPRKIIRGRIVIENFHFVGNVC